MKSLLFQIKSSIHQNDSILLRNETSTEHNIRRKQNPSDRMLSKNYYQLADALGISQNFICSILRRYLTDVASRQRGRANHTLTNEEMQNTVIVITQENCEPFSKSMMTCSRRSPRNPWICKNINYSGL